MTIPSARREKKDVDRVEREQSSAHRAQTCHDPALEEPRAIGERGGRPGQEHESLRCIRQAEVGVGHMREHAVRHVVGEDRQQGEPAPEIDCVYARAPTHRPLRMLRIRFVINANSPPLSLADGDAFPAVLLW